MPKRKLTLAKARRDALRKKPKGKLTESEKKMIGYKPKPKKIKMKSKIRHIPNPRGAITKYTPNVVEKLLWCWDRNMTDIEASAHVGVSTQTIQNWLKKYPEFKEQRDMHKHNLVIQSKMKVHDEVTKKKGGADTARRVLDREVYKKDDTPAVNININAILEQLRQGKELIVQPKNNDISNG